MSKMRFHWLRNFFIDLSFNLKRLWLQRSLVLCLAVGLVVASALAVTVPLYADAVNYNLLNASLSDSTAATHHRPLFSFIFNYVGSWHIPLTVTQYRLPDQFMQKQLAGVIALPVQRITRMVLTDNLQLYPNGNTISRAQRLDLVKLSFLAGVFEQVRLVEGSLPQTVTHKGAPIEALVSLQLANDLGLKVGGTYLLYTPDQVGGQPFQQRVKLTGIWLPKDAQDSYWFYAPESYDKKLLIPEAVS